MYMPQTCKHDCYNILIINGSFLVEPSESTLMFWRKLLSIYSSQHGVSFFHESYIKVNLRTYEPFKK